MVELAGLTDAPGALFVCSAQVTVIALPEVLVNAVPPELTISTLAVNEPVPPSGLAAQLMLALIVWLVQVWLPPLKVMFVNITPEIAKL